MFICTLINQKTTFGVIFVFQFIIFKRYQVRAKLSLLLSSQRSLVFFYMGYICVLFGDLRTAVQGVWPLYRSLVNELPLAVAGGNEMFQIN